MLKSVPFGRDSVQLEQLLLPCILLPLLFFFFNNAEWEV